MPTKLSAVKSPRLPLWVVTHALPWTPGGIWASVRADSKREAPELLGQSAALCCRCHQLRLAKTPVGLMEMSVLQSWDPPHRAALYFHLFFHQAFIEYLPCGRSSAGYRAELQSWRLPLSSHSLTVWCRKCPSVVSYPVLPPPHPCFPSSNRATTSSSIFPCLWHFGRLGLGEDEGKTGTIGITI